MEEFDLAARRVLAISSGGGHWVELMRLRPAFEDAIVSYATVRTCDRGDVGDDPFCTFSDVTRRNRFSGPVVLIQIIIILLRVRPHAIVTTGAMPGFLAIRLGRLLGVRSVWIDSIANVEELSMSGQMAGVHVDLWLNCRSRLRSRAGR